MIVKNLNSLILICLILTVGCCSQKKLETAAPFTLGEVYAQKWIVEDDSKDSGYNVVIPIMSLDENEAILQNLYPKNRMVDLTMKLSENGMIAIAKYSKEDTLTSEILVPQPSDKNKRKNDPKIEPFPFDLQETEAVLSYLQNDKIRYVKLSGIRQNPVVVYSFGKARK